MRFFITYNQWDDRIDWIISSLPWKKLEFETYEEAFNCFVQIADGMRELNDEFPDDCIFSGAAWLLHLYDRKMQREPLLSLAGWDFEK